MSLVRGGLAGLGSTGLGTTGGFCRGGVSGFVLDTTGGFCCGALAGLGSSGLGAGAGRARAPLVCALHLLGSGTKLYTTRGFSRTSPPPGAGGDGLAPLCAGQCLRKRLRVQDSCGLGALSVCRLCRWVRGVPRWAPALQAEDGLRTASFRRENNAPFFPLFPTNHPGLMVGCIGR